MDADSHFNKRKMDAERKAVADAEAAARRATDVGGIAVAPTSDRRDGF